MATQWRQRRALTSLMVVSSLLLAMSPQVLSFGTVNSLGQKTEHEHITRAAPDAFPFEEPSPAHCDDADFFDSATHTPGKASYPVSREAATFALQVCIAHLQLRFEEGKASAKGLLDSKDRIIKSQVDLLGGVTVHLYRPLKVERNAMFLMVSVEFCMVSRTFTATASNWADTAVLPFTPENPPGLGLPAPASVLDLRSATSSPSFSVPNDLSTGCYDGVGSDETPGIKKCLGWVTHNTLNKDKGTIDEVTGKTTLPTTSRGQIGSNFENAVRGAIIETRRQWQDFRAELEIEYGARRASLMVCALTRDDPVKSCQGRKIAIVIDSSGSNTETDPSNLRIAAAQAFNSMLVTEADAGPDGLPDRVTVVDFDGFARVIYPLGDPSRATFDIDSSGDTFIAGGVAVAIGELTKDPNDPTADRTGIVVLTDGEDSDIGALVLQIVRAQNLGIRVAFEICGITTSGTTCRVTAILKTGGFFSKISSAETQRAFIDLVITHGPTNFDNAKGSNDGGPLSPGLVVSGLASASSGPDIFTYHGLRGDQLTFTIQSMNHQSLKAVVRDVRASVVIKECTTDAQGKALITFTVSKEADFELIISTTDANEGVYSVGLEVSPKCDRCPCNGTLQCVTTDITSSTTLIYIETFCITAPNPTTTTPLPPLNSMSTTTPTPPLKSTPPSVPPSISTPPSIPLSRPSSINRSNSISQSSICSTTTIFQPATTVRRVTICPSSSFITPRPSLSPSTTKSTSHRNLAASGLGIQGTLTPHLDADKEGKSFRVFVALICVIAVQSAMILGALIWWCCFGRNRRGSYTPLQGDGRTKFMPEWMASWTPRHGYSKAGDAAPLGITATEPETKEKP